MEYRGKRIAVIGVSDNREKFGSRIFRDLLAAGYDVAGVNKRGGQACGKPVYRSLREIGAVPELVITVVPPAITEHIAVECGELGVREIWMQPGSSSPKAVAVARAAGITVIDSRCFMVEVGLW
ncbi:MAG: CoA-binding protein [Candidatus Omnitrophota bacterium]